MERMVAMNQDSEIMVYRISKVSPSTRNVDSVREGMQSNQEPRELTSGVSRFDK